MSGWDIPLYNDNQTSPSSDDTGNIGNRRGSSHLVLDIQSRRVPTKASTQDNQHVISFLYLQRYNEVGHIVPMDDITEPKRHEAELSQSLTLGLNQTKDHTVQGIYLFCSLYYLYLVLLRTSSNASSLAIIRL